MSSQILNKYTNIHLSLIPQYPISQFMLLYFRNVIPNLPKIFVLLFEGPYFHDTAN